MSQKNEITLKYINLIFKILKYLHIKQHKNIIYLKNKKKVIPIIFFLQTEGYIYKFSFKKDLIKIFFKNNRNISFIKQLKIFTFKNHHDYKKIFYLILLKKKKKFKIFSIFTQKGILSLDKSLSLKQGGIVITQLN